MPLEVKLCLSTKVPVWIDFDINPFIMSEKFYLNSVSWFIFRHLLVWSGNEVTSRQREVSLVKSQRTTQTQIELQASVPQNMGKISARNICT